jgi:hypothetical protein
MLKKLHTLKSILQTSKSINWAKVGDYYGAESISLIKQLKQRIGIFLAENQDEAGENQQDRMAFSHSDGNQPDESRKKKEESSSTGEKAVIPKVIENALINIPVFTDPHTVIVKIVSGDAGLNKVFGGNGNTARQHVIDTLYNAGKIFSYNKKHYIGFGKLAQYIYNKDNKDYNKQALAQTLPAFLARFPGNALKAAFLGIKEENLGDFLHMLEAWIHPGNPPVDTIAGKKKTRQKKQDNRDKTAPETHEDKTRQVLTHKNQDTTKKIHQSDTTHHSKEKRTFTRRKKKTFFSPEKERRKKTRRISDRNKTKKTRDRQMGNQQKRRLPKLSARSEAMLKKAEKLITEKLLFLIKLYNNREPMKMLYNSYLSPSSDKKYRLNLIDQRKHAAIYNAIKDDDAVLERLRFDVNKVMKQYQKKLKKIKK